MTGEIKTKSDLMIYLTRMAMEYSPKCKESVKQNQHMNLVIEEDVDIALGDDNIVEAVLVDFVNYIGNNQGLDWGLYTKHLHEEKEIIHYER